MYISGHIIIDVIKNLNELRCFVVHVEIIAIVYNTDMLFNHYYKMHANVILICMQIQEKLFVFSFRTLTC